MNAVASADAFHRRRDAMFDFEEGRLPESETKLTILVEEIGHEARADARAELCGALIDRATVRRLSNRPGDALDDLEAALRAAEPLPSIQRRAVLVKTHNLRARILASQASAAHDLGRAHEALAELRRLTSGWQTDELESELAFRERRWERAAEFALVAAQQVAADGWPVAEAVLRRRAGEAYLELGALDDADAELRLAFEVLARSGSPDTLASARRVLARLELARGNHDVAWEHALAALDGIESLIRRFRLLEDQERFLEDKLAYYDVAFDVGLARGGHEGVLRAWSVAERAKSCYLCQLVANADVRLFDGVDPARIARLHAIEDALDALERAKTSKAPPAGVGGLSQEQERRLEELSRQKQELLGRLMRDNPRWGGLRVPPKLDLVDELERLGHHDWTPLSYFWRTDEGSATLHLFVQTPGGEPRHLATSWSAAEIGALDAARAQLRGRVPVTAGILPRELGVKLFPDELTQLLEASRKLLVSPHDRLRALPLHTADLGRASLPIDRWPMLYIPTLSLLPLRREHKPGERVLLIGSSDNAFGDPTLREIKHELDEIGDRWREKRPGRVTRKIVGITESPRAAGVGIESWADCEYVHVACHGHFPEGRPLDAALRLGTDAVRTSEFFAASLRARLVSLSACSLGRQKQGGRLVGDEWMGLYAPLFYAGADALLVSVWDAYSRYAADFMIALHRRIAEGARPANAFFEAVKSLRGKPLPLWANWYLAGAPGDEKEE